MCGIIGYTGRKNGSEIVIQGLRELEYRGYDSWGLAALVMDADKHISQNIFIHKETGKISDFKDADSLPSAKVAIGHTRWSTHGGASVTNAHPHTCCKKKVAVVHNGIIENYEELKREIKHHKYISETDTEVIAHLIGDAMDKGKTFEDAFKECIGKIEGRFAIVAVTSGSDEIAAARKGSPLAIGVSVDGHYVASDPSAFSMHTDRAIFLEDGDIAFLNSKLEILDADGKKVDRKITRIIVRTAEDEGTSYTHSMIKEIMEQRITIHKATEQPEDTFKKAATLIKQTSSIFLIGCGTAGKAAMIGEYLFAKIANRRATMMIGSEYPKFARFFDKDTLLISISQSGETADSLEAIDAAKKKGAKILSIVNAENSTMTRVSDAVLLCNSGTERAVCSTKATTAQIAILALLAYTSIGKKEQGINMINRTAEQAAGMLESTQSGLCDKIRQLAKKIASRESIYLIGRGINYPVALESAIKLQEVPYIHAEGFAGGELKHGPIALIEKGTPCIALVANDESMKETIINAMEIRARGAYIIGISPVNSDVFDFWIEVPDAGIMSPIINLIPIQLLSYYTALEKKIEPDKPRNLAKSVTVK